ncbi:MAG TPA: glycosyltransferase family 2 protein [Stellaceae bacterium]|nr:glycosyltransferase family 2 protein [Stellaceae bacterium]
MNQPITDLSVVIPVRNEAENIAPLVAEIAAALAGGPGYEIIYVDDGSTDETAARVRGLMTAHPTLRLLRHDQSYGQSTAVRTGVKAAAARWIATLDGDGQNDPADIPALWRMAMEVGGGGAAAAATPGDLPLLIAGHRAKRRDTAIKRLSSRIANRVRARLLGDATPDTGCGLKLFRRDTFLDLPYFDHMHRFLPALVIRAGGRVVSVRVNHRPRERGHSNYGTMDRLWVGITDIIGVMWLQRRAKRPIVRPD